MVGLKITSKEIEDIVQVLGLADDEQGKVYLSLLSLGMATLGQISLISGLDYLKTQEALNVLVGSNLVSRIPGKVGRYFAQEPFLKAFSLAYDPITLLNVKKEASNIIEADIARISTEFNTTTQTFRKNAKDFENGFSQSMNPMILNFNGLTDNLRRGIKSSHDSHLNIIKENDDNINLTKEILKQASEQLYSYYLSNIDGIPNIFKNTIPLFRQNLISLIQSSENMTNEYQTKYNLDLKSLEELMRKKVVHSSENLTEKIKEFEIKRAEGHRDFEKKIIEINSAIEVLQLKAIQSKSKFQEMKNGYGKIDEGVISIFTEINSKINSMEPIIENLVDDIQKRKLFKGKDVVLDDLNQIIIHKQAIQNALEENKSILNLIDTLNLKMNETENELVNATEKGLQDVKKIVHTEVGLFSEFFNDLKEKIDKNSRLIKENCDKQTQEIANQIITLNNNLDKKITEFNKFISFSEEKFVTELSELIKNQADGFKNDLKKFFEEKKKSETITDNLSNLLGKNGKIRDNLNEELEKNLNRIAYIENEFKSFLEGLNTFTSSYTEVQVESFISMLDRVQEIVNSHSEDFEKKIENEISALTFSIKDMKQKLNKISDSSRMVEYSDIDTTLLTSHIVIGESSIIVLLKDLTVRAKSSLTVLMPRPELQTMIAASKLPMKTRVSIIGDFHKVPESTLKKILSSGNVRLKQLDGIEFWGCIRDAEELLICPEPKDPEKEELIGIITTNENLVELFSQEIMTYTTRSREIIL